MNEDPPSPNNDATPDGPVEARIVAWVLGEASAFEAAELERLCAEKPELLIFRRRMRELHGLLTEAEAAEPDESWKLPAEKRKVLDEIFGQEKVYVLSPDLQQERRISHSGRRAALAIAACVVVTFFVIRLVPTGYEAEATLEIKPRSAGTSLLNSESAGQQHPSTPQFFGTEFNLIKGDTNLGTVVDKLSLTDRWGLDRDTAIRRLRENVKTENIKGTDLVSIRVRGASNDEAIEITRAVAESYRDYKIEIENREAEKALAELNKAIRDQQDKVEERRKVLATIVRKKGIIYKGQDSFYGQSEVYEDQGARGVDEIQQEKDTSEDAIKRGLDNQDYVDAKRDFETDQELLQQMRLKEIDRTIRDKMTDDSIVMHEMPKPVKRWLDIAGGSSFLPAEKKAAKASAAEMAPSAPAAAHLADLANAEESIRAKRQLERANVAPAKKEEVRYKVDSEDLARTRAADMQAGARQQQLAKNRPPADAPAPPPAEPQAMPELSDSSEMQPLPRAEQEMSIAGNMSGLGGSVSPTARQPRPRVAPPALPAADKAADSFADAGEGAGSASKAGIADDAIAAGDAGVVGSERSSQHDSQYLLAERDLTAPAESAAPASERPGIDKLKKQILPPALVDGAPSGSPTTEPANPDAAVPSQIRAGANLTRSFGENLSSSSPEAGFDMVKRLEETKAPEISRFATYTGMRLGESQSAFSSDVWGTAYDQTTGYADRSAGDRNLFGNSGMPLNMVDRLAGKDAAEIEALKKRDPRTLSVLAGVEHEFIPDSLANDFIREQKESNPAIAAKAREDALPEEIQRREALAKADLAAEIPAGENPYSTFSLNISDASFQLAKAALAKGERPEPGSIKPEQFYNAVDYGDPAPAAREPVAATIEQSIHPVIPGRKLVRVAVRTGAAGRSASQPLRLTLLVDQSGSMVREDRRAAMERALSQLSGLLTKADVVNVIGFSRTPRLLADGLTGDQSAKLGALVNQTASEGGTNLEEALKLGSELASRHHLAGAQNRIVLFTDGAANLGDADPARLAGQVKTLRQKGIAFDIAGIAADDLNDHLLSELARNGNGRYYVVGDDKEGTFARQLAGAFRPAAENVKIQVIFNPRRVAKYRLVGFEKDRLKTEDFRNDAVDAAELAAEETGTAIYQVEEIPDGAGEIGELSVRFRDTASGEMVERSWTMPHESAATAFDRATPSMQLAGLSLLAAEKLRGGPLADAIDFKQLSGTIGSVKQFYGSSSRAADMLRVIESIK